MTTTTRASRPAGHAHHYNAAQQAHDDFLSIHLSPSTARDLQDRRGARTTLSHFDDSSDEDEYEDEEEMHTPTTSSHSHIPLHPIESMQEAFAESLEEATRSGVSLKPKLKAQDAKARREKLLDEDKSQGPPNRLWRFRPGQKCHELRKLIAQIAFGIELLMKGMANSNAQVLSILQGHIDEVDEFLETTMDDVNEAIKDLKERLDFLKVPMLNIEVFEQMLEKRKFRAQILEGNAKIEHILSRTSTAHTQTIRDISEGVRAIQQFSEYLTDHEHKSWRRERPDVIDVFDAMKGNTEGWYNAFTTLEANSTLLSGLLVQLSTMVVDINKKAAEISRRTRLTLEPGAGPDLRSNPRSPGSPSQATPPPSPPSSKTNTAPRIGTLCFDDPITSFLQGPASPEIREPPPRSKQRITKDSDTLRDTMLASQLYTPPESSKTIPEVVVAQETVAEDEDSEAQSVTGSTTDTSTGSPSPDDDKTLYLLQPRTYTPVPPAPIPSPRVSAVQRDPPVATRGTPDELSIHIEAEEDMPQSNNDVRETILTFPLPERDRRRAPSSSSAQPKPLQLTAKDKQPRSSDKEVVLGHKTSLRDRVSLKERLPTAIHVPPVNAYEIQRPRYAETQASPRGPRAPGSSHGSHVSRGKQLTKHHTTNLDFSPPKFPSLIPSPASERQHFRPVQASPHSPLQQRPHTAGPGSQRSGHHDDHHHNRNAPSQMGMSTLSSVTTMTNDLEGGSTRTVKKKRSAFGWLKKAFSLDEEERAAFEARRRGQPLNYQQQYQTYQTQSPRYLDGRRVG